MTKYITNTVITSDIARITYRCDCTFAQSFRRWPRIWRRLAVWLARVDARQRECAFCRSYHKSLRGRWQ